MDREGASRNTSCGGPGFVGQQRASDPQEAPGSDASQEGPVQYAKLFSGAQQPAQRDSKITLRGWHCGTVDKTNTLYGPQFKSWLFAPDPAPWESSKG